MMVDTNVVIDLITPGSRWFDWAESTVSGVTTVTASAIVIAELAAAARDLEETLEILRGLGIDVIELDAVAAFHAGRAQAAFRAAGGKREKMLGDFLIGAHAMACNLPLATRDPKPYRRYFPELTLITPETENG